MLNRSDLLLLVLRSAGEIQGKTRLFKILYIVQEELKKAGIKVDFYAFGPYLYGPFSHQVDQALRTLVKQRNQMLHTSEVVSGLEQNSYRITLEGIARLERVEKEMDKKELDRVISVIDRVVKKYKEYPLTWLLRDVYSDYRAFLSNSTVRSDSQET